MVCALYIGLIQLTIRLSVLHNKIAGRTPGKYREYDVCDATEAGSDGEWAL